MNRLLRPLLKSTAIFLFGVLALAPAARAVITYDGASTLSLGGGTNIYSWSHTVGAGANSMLVVAVTTESNPDRTVTNVTFGAQALTKVPGARAVNGATTANASDLWYLPAPAVGSGTITVTLSGNVGAGFVAGAVSLFGVVQGAPEAVTNYFAGNGGTYSASITPLTDGAWLVDVVNNGTQGATFTPDDPSQTLRWTEPGVNHAAAGSTRETRLTTPPGAVTDAWTSTGGSRRALSVAAFAPVTSPAPAADIVAFGLPGLPAAIDQLTSTITWNLPYGTDVKTLAPTYTKSLGATCPLASGSTNDFTSPVHYIVKSSDLAITHDYTVTVTLLPLVATNTYNLGPQDSGTTILTDVAGLIPWIAKGTLPPGSILRSFSVNARLDSMAAGSDSWADDLAPYVDPNPQAPGTTTILQVGGYNVIGTVGTRVPWGTGQSGPPTPLVATKTEADWNATTGDIDLNTVQLSLGNGYSVATWSGTISATYSPPPATFLAFGSPGNLAVYTSSNTLTWSAPYGTVLSAAAPTYTLSSGTCDKASGSTQNFTTPQTYTVIDGAITNVYTVTVIVITPPILFGATGSGTLPFDTLPDVSAWSTAVIPGGSGAATSPKTLDTLVNTVAASFFNLQLGTVTADPAGTTTQLGQWNSTDLRLTSRAGSSAATPFMATLKNTSGAAINEFDLSFTLYGSAAANEDPGLAGYAVYYNLTGAMGNWRRIGVYGTTGPVSVKNILLNSAWAAGATMYVLWVDDNGAPGGDGWWGFDDVAFAKSTPAANMLSFDFPVYGPATISGNAITIKMLVGTDVTALKPTYTTTYGATCSKASGSAQNFTSPVHYIVRSADGLITNDYQVTINLVAPSGKTYVNIDVAEREGLVGPAGGLGETWNQVTTAASTSVPGNMLSASGLRDSAGAPSTTGFALSSFQLALFEWGNPSLTLLRSGAFSWAWDTNATLVISNLTVGKKYDLYLASFHPNEGGSSSVFSTTNLTTTVGDQIVNTGGPAGNDTNWVELANYARFANVQPDAAGKITVNMVGNSGTSTIRAYLSGFQLLEVGVNITGFTMGPVAGQFTLQGTASVDGNVMLLKSTDVTAPLPSWSQVGSSQAVTAGTPFSFIIQGADPRAFYRLELVR